MVTDTNFEKNENPTFIDGCNIGGKRGIYVKGENVIHLDTPEICFPENAPLHNTDKRELYAILDELFQGGSGGGDDDWSPPEWWIPVPEPDEYDIYILVWAEKIRNKFVLSLIDGSTMATGLGTIICDYGDGTTETLLPGTSYYALQHIYNMPGQYLIKITGDSKANFVQSAGNYDAVSWQIFKSGSGISFFSDYSESNNLSYSTLFTDRYWLKYIKINNSKGLPVSKTANYFAYCYSLQKIDLVKKISGELSDYTFQHCYGLKKTNQFSVDCKNITRIGQYAFGNCYRLETIDCPNCASIAFGGFMRCFNLMKANFLSCTDIDDSGFVDCYNLQEIKTSDSCTFGKSCFQYCYSLYPRPDGSVN